MEKVEEKTNLEHKYIDTQSGGFITAQVHKPTR